MRRAISLRPGDKLFSILTVDDEATICDVISDFLIKRGYKVRKAQSGEEALELIDDDKPNIVLLDLNMPGMGGEAALKEIKKRYQDLPVIIVTVIDNERKALDLLNKGASDYISKPVDLRYLERSISAWESISINRF